MRHLFYVPIIHAEADLGSLGQAIKQNVTATRGNDSWAERQRSIDTAWTVIRNEVLALPINWKNTRIYQDGLPICGHELAIVKDVAAKGSHNHLLLVELIERGATLMGTEDPVLLVREYQRVQRLVKLAATPLQPAVIEQIKREGQEILRQRDVFITERIVSTLEPHESGVLLIGLLHRVDELLQGRGISVHNVTTNLSSSARTQSKPEANKQ